MRRFIYLLIITFYLYSQQTEFEKSGMTATANPYTVMDFYNQLANQYDFVKVVEAGRGDSNRPIYTVIVSKKRIFTPDKLDDELVFLIQNGIHSGESGGIDASQMIVRDYAKKMASSAAYDNLVLVIIPVYNVGGHIKFSPYNRVNQNGPEQMGFRGNGRNYDLNRDYMKMDTKNRQVFGEIFHNWQPHLFLDNHCTDGADYQDAMTYMMNNQELDHQAVRNYISQDFLPFMEKDTKRQNYPITTYVDLKTRNKIEDGIDYFRLSPRFSTGFTALFNKISVLVETHMLKPYKDRVLANYAFMVSMIEKAITDNEKIQAIIEEANRDAIKAKEYTVRWQKDYNRFDEIDFAGFAYEMKFYDYFNAPLITYDRSKPVTYKIKHYNHFNPEIVVDVPKAYIIPQEWHTIIDKLKQNHVEMEELKSDKEYKVEMYRFDNAKWANRPYEGHFMLNDFDLKTETVRRRFRAGDYMIPMNQVANSYIMEALEPKAVDSFAAWGFFSTLFQQKEYFDPYIFVNKIDAIFKADPQLKKDFEEKAKSDPDFAKNPYLRFNYIYQRSPYYEKHTYLLYPIARLMN
ncbi:MAG: hypothetical protein KDD94_07065 [Calditrichaeota bacterium]|nr:hypothetical protein [Calditrichota bacterium]